MRRWPLVLFAFCLGCAAAPQESQWNLDAVAEAHAAADRALSVGDAAGARASLEEAFVRLKAIPRAAQRREVSALVLDTGFRIARLSLADGHAANARARADEALGFSDGRDDLLVANLLLVRAAAREADKDFDGAAADYGRALSINEELLRQSLEQGDQ